MSKYSTYKDVDAVLQNAEKALNHIKKSYQDALEEKEVPGALLVEIKDYFGNLRSALDYLNNKLPGHDKYFPICNSQRDFDNQTTNIDSETKTVLNKWQPFNNNEWLRHFSILNNKNKHLTLIPQVRTESQQISVSSGSGSVSWGPGVTFGSGVSVMGVPIDPRTQLPVPNNIVETKRTIWVSFIFDGSVSPELANDINVINFVDVIFTRITKLVKEIEDTV